VIEEVKVATKHVVQVFGRWMIQWPEGNTQAEFRPRVLPNNLDPENGWMSVAQIDTLIADLQELSKRMKGA